jgi:hypothetical protein
LQANARVTLDLNGLRVRLAAAEIAELRDAAAADGGRSSARRDLSLILDRALQMRTSAALRRAEARELAHLLDEHELTTRFPRLCEALTAALQPRLGEDS